MIRLAERPIPKPYARRVAKLRATRRFRAAVAGMSDRQVLDRWCELAASSLGATAEATYFMRRRDRDKERAADRAAVLALIEVMALAAEFYARNPTITKEETNAHRHV